MGGICPGALSCVSHADAAAPPYSMHMMQTTRTTATQQQRPQPPTSLLTACRSTAPLTHPLPSGGAWPPQISEQVSRIAATIQTALATVLGDQAAAAAAAPAGTGSTPTSAAPTPSGSGPAAAPAAAAASEGDSGAGQQAGTARGKIEKMSAEVGHRIRPHPQLRIVVVPTTPCNGAGSLRPSAHAAA